MMKAPRLYRLDNYFLNLRILKVQDFVCINALLFIVRRATGAQHKYKKEENRKQEKKKKEESSSTKRES